MHGEAAGGEGQNCFRPEIGMEGDCFTVGGEVIRSVCFKSTMRREKGPHDYIHTNDDDVRHVPIDTQTQKQ